MNELSKELNQDIAYANTDVFKMLSEVGKKLFFPKGILTQSAEAKKRAVEINATIGIAKENNRIMHLASLMENISQIKTREALSYSPSFGISDLRKAWQIDLYKKNPSLHGKKISLPIVTCGITHGISTIADIWIDPNDVVIIPDMAWGNYNMILAVRKGARLAQYSMFSDNGGFNLKEFSEKLQQESQINKKIIVLLNFPHNPSGYSVSKEEGLQIAKVLNQTAQSGTRVIVICDDAYFGLFYEDNTLKESLFSMLSNSHKKLLAIKIDGATKEYFSWGLRVGFITYGSMLSRKNNILYNALEMKTAGCIRGSISNTSHLSQTLLLKSLKNKNNTLEKQEKFNILKDRAQMVKKVLENKLFAETWKAYPFNSGYFMCIKLKTVNSNKLRTYLLEKYGIGVISIKDKNIRIAFSCIETNDIVKLFKTIYLAIKELQTKCLNE